MRKNKSLMALAGLSSALFVGGIGGGAYAVFNFKVDVPKEVYEIKRARDSLKKIEDSLEENGIESKVLKNYIEKKWNSFSPELKKRADKNEKLMDVLYASLSSVTLGLCGFFGTGVGMGLNYMAKKLENKYEGVKEK